MRKVFLFNLLGFIAACGTTEKITLDETSKIEFFKPLYKMIYPGQEDGNKTVVLVLPYQKKVEGCSADSVYFMGYHQALNADMKAGQLIYHAKINMEKNHIAVTPPFALKEKEALVTYISDNKKHYFIVKNIVEEEPLFMP